MALLILVTMRQSIGQLLKRESHELMLARASEKLAFNVVDPAVPPKHGVCPKRSMITVVVTLLGVLGGASAVLLSNSMRPKTQALWTPAWYLQQFLNYTDYTNLLLLSMELRMKSNTGRHNLLQRMIGFTLIEILIVIVIMGLLVSLVAPTLFSKVSSSKKKTAEAQMQMISTALDTYRLDMGSYPERLDELRRSDQPGWDGPYMPRDIPDDPWGNPYVYSPEGNDEYPYSLLSYGAGGVPGGEDEEEDIIFQ